VWKETAPAVLIEECFTFVLVSSIGGLVVGDIYVIINTLAAFDGTAPGECQLRFQTSAPAFCNHRMVLVIFK
jgi:hypothetical protein